MNKKITYWLIFALFIVVIDQLLKQLVVNIYQLGEYTQITSFFNITRVHNTGAAFSFLSEYSGWQSWVFIILALISTYIIISLLKKDYQQSLYSFSLMCILGGAIGNMLDRIFYQYVIDFIHFYMPAYGFPVFNFADIAITVGAIGLLISAFKK